MVSLEVQPDQPEEKVDGYETALKKTVQYILTKILPVVREDTPEAYEKVVLRLQLLKKVPPTERTVDVENEIKILQDVVEDIHILYVYRKIPLPTFLEEFSRASKYKHYNKWCTFVRANPIDVNILEFLEQEHFQGRDEQSAQEFLIKDCPETLPAVYTLYKKRILNVASSYLTTYSDDLIIDALQRAEKPKDVEYLLRNMADPASISRARDIIHSLPCAAQYVKFYDRLSENMCIALSKQIHIDAINPLIEGYYNKFSWILHDGQFHLGWSAAKKDGENEYIEQHAGIIQSMMLKLHPDVNGGKFHDMLNSIELKSGGHIILRTGDNSKLFVTFTDKSGKYGPYSIQQLKRYEDQIKDTLSTIYPDNEIELSILTSM